MRKTILTADKLEKYGFEFFDSYVFDWDADEDTDEGFIYENYRIKIHIGLTLQVSQVPEGDFQASACFSTKPGSENEEILMLRYVTYLHELDALYYGLTGERLKARPK